MKTVSIDRLREIFGISEVGELVHKFSRGGVAREGETAGSLNSRGYVQVRVDCSTHSAHRVVFAMHNGYWPAGNVDHINGIRHDNRPDNLREVSLAINRQNRRPASDNNSGLLGVHRERGKFRARIYVDGKSTCLGSHKTAEEAHAAYVEAKRVMHPGCTI